MPPPVVPGPVFDAAMRSRVRWCWERGGLELHLGLELSTVCSCCRLRLSPTQRVSWEPCCDDEGARSSCTVGCLPCVCVCVCECV